MIVASLRSAAFAAWFYGVTLLLGLAGIGVRLFAPRRALPFAQFWVGVVFRGLRATCGIRVAVAGREHLPAAGPALLACQHQSAFDTLVWMVLLDRPSYVMKQELRRIPLFGPLLVPAGMIPVDRAAGAAALRSLLAETGRAAADGRQIVIFPEGTRTPPGTQVRLHPGIAAIATRTGLAVLPVATDSGRCWPRGVLAKRPGTIHIAIGPPIPATCPRGAMLAQVERFWRDMEAAGFEPVDNSVGAPPPMLAARRARGG